MCELVLPDWVCAGKCLPGLHIGGSPFPVRVVPDFEATVGRGCRRGATVYVCVHKTALSLQSYLLVSDKARDAAAVLVSK